MEPPAADAVLSWLEARRSVRAYRPGPLSRELVRRLLQGARSAPSGHNARSVGCVALLSDGEKEKLTEGLVSFYRRLFRVLERPGGASLLGLLLGRGAVRELREAAPSMARAEARLEAGADPLFHRAPCLLLFHAPKSETAEADCVLAASQVTLLAPSLDLGTCYIGYASAGLKRLPRLGRSAGVPASDRVLTVLTVGHPAVAFPRVPPRPELAVRFR
jgi:nitroreductase